MNNTLKNNNLRITKARKEILNILDNSKYPLTAEEIYELAKNEIDINLSTVYRNLSVFQEHGLVLKNSNLDNTWYYQLNRKKHTHQVICLICKKTVSIDFCPIHEITEEIENTTHFKISGHSLEFSGICPECQKKLEK